MHQMLTDSTIWVKTFMNGVSTGTTLTTTGILPNEIRKGLSTPDAERREVAPGATRLKFPEQRRDLAFHRSSNTLTTVSGSRDLRSTPPAFLRKPIWSLSRAGLLLDAWRQGLVLRA